MGAAPRPGRSPAMTGVNTEIMKYAVLIGAAPFWIRYFKALWKELKTGGLHASVTDTSESRTCIRVSGKNARDVLAKGCSLDLHPAKFGPGQCAQTLLGKVGVMMSQTAAAPTYELLVLRSFATYLWAWLEDAAAEYGLKME